VADYVLISSRGFTPFECHREGDRECDSGDETVLSNLRSACRIESGTTLLDLFNAVDRDPALKSFVGLYSWNFWIDSFHENARTPCHEEEPFEDEALVALEVSYGVSADFGSIGWHGDFRGIGERGTQFSVTLTPLESLAHVPIRIAEQSDFREDDELVKSYESSVSLLEFLDAIYYDISFYGGPDDSANLKTELVQRVKEIQTTEYKSRCTIPPYGWRCTRSGGHEGPCAAEPSNELPDI
jgi:hypothetical protein